MAGGLQGFRLSRVRLWASRVERRPPDHHGHPQRGKSLALPKTAALLRELESLRQDFSPASIARTVEFLRVLEGRRLASAKQVHALHEILVFVRAFPGSAEVLATAERLLSSFAERRDLKRYRRELEDTGIAGTDLHFPFYWLSALWLARLWPEALSIDWPEFARKKKLKDVLHLLLPYSESMALDSAKLGSAKWIEALRGPSVTDATFLIRRFEALELETPVREQLYEDLDMPLVLAPGSTTPARGREKWESARVVFQDRPWPSSRPALRRAIPQISFRIRAVGPAQGQRLIDLANACMVNRLRDLYVFLNADPRNVRIVDFGDGLQFACMGAVPERRLVLESVHGFLTLMNGVPIGYVLCSALFHSSEIAYNVFETFRGVGTAHVYARALAMVHQLFGSDSFAIDPYQLGHKNVEGQRSGAWWFYYKLGFRPDDPGVRRLVREERARIAADPSHRTPARRLNRMASKYMFLQLGPKRRDVLGRIDLGRIGLHVSRRLADRHGSDREAGVAACVRESARVLGLRSKRTWSADERRAWERWAPLVQVLPGVSEWTPTQKRALIEIVRSKAAPRESDFVRRFDRHTKLRAALLDLAAREPGATPA